MVYGFFAFILFLTACSGGEVGVSGMGLSVPSASIVQSGKSETVIKVHATTHVAKFQVACDEFSKRVEVSFDQATWQTAEAAHCIKGQSHLSFTVNPPTSMTTWPQVQAYLRMVSDRGIAEASPIKFVVGSPLILEQQIAPITQEGGFVNSTLVTLELNSKFSFDTTSSEATYEAHEMYITSDTTCQAGGQWAAYSETTQFQIPNSNATNAIAVKFRDAGENETSCYSTSVVHDNIGPSLSSFSVLTSGGYINQTTFGISASGSGDYYEMAISQNSVCAGGAWEPLNLAKADHLVGALNSTNVVSLQLRDQAHNVSNCLNTNFIHDDTPPTLPAMTLLTAASPSKKPDPVFQVSGLTAPNSYALYTDGTCSTEISNGIATGTNAFINPTFSSNGTYPIFAILMDSANNSTGCSGPLITYTYDTTAPTVLVKQVGGEAMPSGGTNNQVWDFETTLSSDATFFKWKVGESTTTDCSVATGYSAWVIPSTQFHVDLSSGGDGSKKLCAYAKDGAGNESNPVSYTWNQITSSPIIELSGTPVSPSNATVTNITISNVGVVSYKYKLGLSGSTDCSDSTGYSASFIDVAIPITHNFSGLADGSVKLCVIGKNGGDVETPYALAKEVTWVKDTIGPSLLSPLMTLGVIRPLDGTYYVGEKLVVNLEFNEDVVIAGAATLNALVGGNSRIFNYSKKINDRKLQFEYVVDSADSNLGQFGFASSLSISASTIKDIAGNNSVIQATTPGYVSSVVVSNVSIVFGFSVATQSVKENDGQINVTITASATVPSNVNLELVLDPPAPSGATGYAKQATAGSDFNFNSQDIVFPAGQTSMTFQIPLINDSSVENEVERLSLMLRSASRGEISGTSYLHTILIRDDEAGSDDAVEIVEMVGNGVCFITSNRDLYCLGDAGIGSLSATQKKTATKIMDQVDWVLKGQSSYALVKKLNGDYFEITGGVPTQIFPPANVVEVFKGMTRFCFKTNTESVYCSGAGTYEIPNSAGTNSVNSPAPVAATPLNGLKKMMGSTSTMCALGDFDLNPGTYDTIKCWGDDSLGQLGNGATTGSKTLPFEISGGDIKGLTGNGETFCMWGDFDLNGSTGDTVKCWGRNNYYQAGVAGGSDVTSPTEIADFAGVVAVQAGGYYSFCAIGEFDSGRSGHEVACWGAGSGGNLGNNLSSPSLSVPYVNSIVSDVASIISFSNHQYCAITQSNSLYCWGFSFGTNVTLQSGLPPAPWEISVGQSSVCLRSADGQVACKGYKPMALTSNMTQIKSGISASRHCFISNGNLKCTDDAFWAASNYPVATPVFSGTDVEEIVDDTNCLKLAGKDYLYCSGAAASSKFLTTETNLGAFVKSGVLKEGSLQIGNYPSCRVSTEGVLSCWGESISGFSNVKSPKIVSSGVTSFAATSFSTTSRNSYLSGTYITEGILKYWYQSGAISNVGGFAGGALSVAAGHGHACAIENSPPYKVFCFGNNYTYSPLGNGANYNSVSSIYNHALPSAPVEAIGVTEAVSIDAGATVTCIKRSDKTIMCWGHATQGIPFDPGLIDVEKMKVSTAGRVCVLTSTKYLSCTAGALSSSQVFSQVSTNVDDFWFFGSYLMYKKEDGQIYTGVANMVSTVFGYYYDYYLNQLW